jgi:hypothetical protein
MRYNAAAVQIIDPCQGTASQTGIIVLAGESPTQRRAADTAVSVDRPGEGVSFWAQDRRERVPRPGDKLDKGGRVNLRYQGRLHHIGVGRAYKGWRVILLVAGQEVQILGADGSPLRRLTLDPTMDYQRMP